MKHQLLIALAVLSCQGAFAQMAEVGTAQPILKGVESEMYYPAISADGSKILFTTVNYQGLRCYDVNDNVVKVLSREPRAGLSAAQQFTAADKVKADTKGSQLLITRNGETRSFSPIESYAGYLWASVSPDQLKVLFFAAGKGIVVTDLDGNVLSMPGNYESPVWYGNDHIVAMDATDDGHQFRSSRIVLIKADGSEMQPLTKPESMSMNPTASFAAQKVVYNTIDGLLYQLDVKLR